MPPRKGKRKRDGPIVCGAKSVARIGHFILFFGSPIGFLIKDPDSTKWHKCK